MREVLEALNALTFKGVLKNYAIGGAIGASFYISAVQTEDIDAFVLIAGTAPLLVSLESVYAALQQEGGVVEGAHVRFSEWPLQILTDSNSLVREAIEQAFSVTFADVPTRVFRAEHLLAIALQTGRRKDYLRAAMFLDSGTIDRSLLLNLIDRYSLQEQYERAILEVQNG